MPRIYIRFPARGFLRQICSKARITAAENFSHWFPVAKEAPYSELFLVVVFFGLVRASLDPKSLAVSFEFHFQPVSGKNLGEQ
jgi:hypothetical protein